MEKKSRNHTHTKSKAKKSAPILLVICAVVAIIVAIIVFIKPEANSPIEITPIAETPSITPIVETPSAETDTTSELIIETPYCNLYFPSKWNGQVYTTVKESEGSYEVVFVGKLGDQDINLFSIVFGESEEMPIGTLTQPDGSDVTVRLNVDMFDSTGLNSEQIDMAQSIMESSTYLVERLSESDNFH